jgi:hypothetical protein
MWVPEIREGHLSTLCHCCEGRLSQSFRLAPSRTRSTRRRRSHHRHRHHPLDNTTWLACLSPGRPHTRPQLGPVAPPVTVAPLGQQEQRGDAHSYPAVALLRRATPAPPSYSRGMGTTAGSSPRSCLAAVIARPSPLSNRHPPAQHWTMPLNGEAGGAKHIPVAAAAASAEERYGSQVSVISRTASVQRSHCPRPLPHLAGSRTPRWGRGRLGWPSRSSASRSNEEWTLI